MDMSGSNASRRTKRTPQERIQHRRDRLREAQRRYRGRKDAHVVSLQNQVDELNSRLQKARTSFSSLENVLQESDVFDTDTADRIKSASLLVKETLDYQAPSISTNDAVSPGEGSSHDCIEQYRDSSLYSLPLIGAGDVLNNQDSFAFTLYVYAFSLGYRLVCQVTGPSIRLRRRIFRAYFRSRPDLNESECIDLLRKGLRARLMGLETDSKALKEGTLWSILNEKKFPECKHLLNPGQLEYHLTEKGIKFQKDKAFLPLTCVTHGPQLPIVVDPPLQRDYHIPTGSSNDTVSIPDIQESEEDNLFQLWYQSFEHDRELQTIRERRSERIPFGFGTFAFPEWGTTTETSASPEEQVQEECLPFGIQFDYNSDNDRAQEPVTSPPPSSEPGVWLSISTLVQRIAAIGRCMGKGGPGFALGDVETLLATLTSGIGQ